MNVTPNVIITNKYPEGIPTMSQYEVDKIMKDFIEVELTVDFYDAVNAIKCLGVLNRNRNKLVQTCYIFRKRNNMYVVHHKQLLLLDGKKVKMSEKDYNRTRYIALMMEKFDKLRIKEPFNAEVNPRGLNITYLTTITEDKGDFRMDLIAPRYDKVDFEPRYEFNYMNVNTN